jgi:hypothetical protein
MICSCFMNCILGIPIYCIGNCILSILICYSVLVFIFCYFLPTEIIELECVILFHSCICLSCMYLCILSFPTFFIPLCCTNPMITYFVIRYYHFLGFKWSKLSNSLLSFPAFVVDLFWILLEKAIDLEDY